MRPLRILFIGNHGAPHSTESDMRKELVAMGHLVHPNQEPTTPLIDPNPIDLAIWMHTHGWDWPEMNRFLADMAARGVPTVAITLDLFRGLKRHDPKYVETHPWFRCKYFFQPDEPDYLRSLGVNAYFSPPGILSESCYVSALNENYEAYGKVVFVGSRQYHPEWPWRAELIDWLEKTYGDKFLLYTHDSGLRGDRLNRVYANAAVVVGDSCFASPDSAYTSDRLFETLGRGGRLIYPQLDWVRLDGLLENLVLKYDPGDYRRLREHIDWAIGSFPFGPTYYEAAKSRSAYVREHHAYRHRLQRILDIVAAEEGWK